METKRVLDAIDHTIDCVIEFEMNGQMDKDSPFYGIVECLTAYKNGIVDNITPHSRADNESLRYNTIKSLGKI